MTPILRTLLAVACCITLAGASANPAPSGLAQLNAGLPASTASTAVLPATAAEPDSYQLLLVGLTLLLLCNSRRRSASPWRHIKVDHTPE